MVGDAEGGAGAGERLERALRRQIGALREQRAAVDRELEEAREALLWVVARRGADDESSRGDAAQPVGLAFEALPGRFRARPRAGTRKVVEAMVALLHEAGAPLPVRSIVRGLEERGVRGLGLRPNNTVSAKLATYSERLFVRGREGWELSGAMREMMGRGGDRERQAAGGVQDEGGVESGGM